MPSFRTLRCANAPLYFCATLLVLGAAIHVLCCKDELWQQVVAALAALITPLWTAHYIALRFTVTEESITRRSLRGTTSIRWAELTSATLSETQNQGTASCTIHLRAGDKQMTVSSDLLSLEEVEELAKDLKASGILR